MAALGWLLNLDFAASGAAAVAEVVQAVRAGSRHRDSQWPKKVIIGTVLHMVRSPAELRRLLLEHREKLEKELAAFEKAGIPGEAAKTKRKLGQVRVRIEKAETQEADHIRILQAEDEEILALFAAL